MIFVVDNISPPGAWRDELNARPNWKRDERYRRLIEMGCIACRKNNKFSLPDIHHLNCGGHAGQKRRGDMETIPLCPACHRGVGWNEEDYGPSLALHPKRFRETFGSDDELLEEVNKLLGD